MTSDVCIQELVTKVLCCCQDVLKPFLSSLSATYEPRLSMSWVANMNLVTKVRKPHIWRYTYMYMYKYICSVCTSQTSSLVIEVLAVLADHCTSCWLKLI